MDGAGGISVVEHSSYIARKRARFSAFGIPIVALQTSSKDNRRARIGGFVTKSQKKPVTPPLEAGLSPDRSISKIPTDCTKMVLAR